MKIKKSYIIVPSIITVIVIFVIAAQNHIGAIGKFFTSSQEDLEEQLKTNDEILLKTIEKYSLTEDDDTPSDNEKSEKPDVDEKLDVLLGTDSQSEHKPKPSATSSVTSSAATVSSTTPVTKKIQSTAAQNTTSQINSSTSAPINDKNEKLSEEEIQKKLKSKVKKLYDIKSDYTSVLSGIEKSAIDDYVALPPEQQNASGKQKIVLRHLSKISTMEKECDKKVDEIVKEMKLFLEENNMDTSLCDIIKRYYSEEKELKKAYYMKKVMN